MMEPATGFLMDEPTWAQRVKTVRLKMGITQAELGERLGLDPASVARWESRSERPYSAESERFLSLESEIAEQEDGGVS